MRILKLFILFMVDYGPSIARKQRTMRFLRVQMCPEYPDLPLMVTKFNKRHFADDTFALNISFRIREKLPVNLDASLTLVKCDLAGTPDSCEIYVKDFKVKNLCEKIDMKNQLWSTAIDSIKPPFHCPIEPDNYELNLKRKILLFKFLPLPTATWKEKVIVVGDQKMILCLNVEIQRQRTVQLLRVYSCPENSNLPIMMKSFRRRNFPDGSYSVNMTFEVSEKLSVNLEAFMSLVKCDLAGTPDSCEYYIKDFSVKNVCEKVEMKNQLWSRSISRIKPALRCPIQPEQYELRIQGKNELFQFLPLPTGVWKAKVLVMDSQKNIFCVFAEVKVIERKTIES